MASSERTLEEIGEDELVRRLTAGLTKDKTVVVGPGDDCAVIQKDGAAHWQLLKTDCLLQGVHYLPEADPEQVGWKAMARTISDIAAMGGLPAHGLVTVVLSPTSRVQRAEALYRGLQKAADQFGVTIVGGETSSTPPGAPEAEMISVCLTGTVEPDRCVTRSGGQPGDVLMVTGRLGGSGSGRHLTFEPRLREARWLTESFCPTAMMDLSDGLARDLPRMARASGTGFQIDGPSLPCHDDATVDQALNDGEDYELLFAVPAARVDSLIEAWAGFSALPLTRIGQLDNNPDSVPLEGGWEHFRSRQPSD